MVRRHWRPTWFEHSMLRRQSLATHLVSVSVCIALLKFRGPREVTQVRHGVLRFMHLHWLPKRHENTHETCEYCTVLPLTGLWLDTCQFSAPELLANLISFHEWDACVAADGLRL